MSESQQQFIQSILDKVYPFLNQPSNPFYVPKYVTDNHLDPYQPPPGSTWGMKDMQNQSVLDQIQAVCRAIEIHRMSDPPCSNSKYFYNAVPKTGPDVTLSNIVVKGISNAYVQGATATSADGFTIQVVINFSTLPNFPKPISVTGDFSFTLYCCCGPGKNCDPNLPSNPETATGTFIFAINNSSATATFQITDLAEGILNVEVKKIQYSATPANIKVTPTITSIPPDELAAYNNLVNEAFSATDTLEYVLDQVNIQLNEPNALSQMSTVLQNELDGYLKANHQYPFDKSGSAAF
jgi:hypothetical protein